MNKNKKIPKLQDLASELGLSVSTISRALSNHPNISDKTKRLVIAEAKKMGYAPNLFARSLAKRKTFLIGLILTEIRDNGVASLAMSAQKTLEDAGYWVIFCDIENDFQRADTTLKSLVQMGVDGIIYAATKLEDRTVEDLIDSGYSIVLINRKLGIEKGSYVISDYQYGAYLGVNHLLNLGYRRIGIIHGSLETSPSADSLKGYVKALQERDIPIENEIIQEVKFNMDTGFAAAKRLLQLDHPPEAIYCYDDYMALETIHTIHESGMRVPEDIAVVGADDVDISRHARINLTTIRHNLKKIGQLGAKIVIDQIEGRISTPQRIQLAPELVIRDSCGYKQSILE
jgi:LacI family transcriptional regulator